MSKKFMGFFILTAVVSLLVSSANAAPFEQLFRIKSVTGDCTVKTADSKEFVAAEEGRAYPYGTSIKTGRKSSAVILFSDGNTCRVLANASLNLSEDTKDKKLKTIRLSTGKIEVKLEEEFHNHNGLNVETATSICGAIGCEFSVEVRIEADLEIVVVLIIEGRVDVFGDNYRAMLGTGHGISISGAFDRSFIRLKNIQGKFNMIFRQPDNTQKEVETLLGAVVKIWERAAESSNMMIITILITDPQGNLLEAITYEVPRPTLPDSTTTTTGEAAAGQDENNQQQQPPGRPTTTTSTTVTTTTTTIPPEDVANNNNDNNNDDNTEGTEGTGGGSGGGSGSDPTTTTTQPPTPTPVGFR